MTHKRQQTGHQGEEIAAAHFSEIGYRILQRNWRCSVGELDIVMEDGKGTLVFVEVRTRKGVRFGSAEESITTAKQTRLVELAQSYLQETDAPHRSWRIDVATVRLGQGLPQINHIENAIGW